ncbi:MAG: PEP-CTERM sorting domain-containing protein [Burkholderiaceae bacterium]
MNIRKRLWWAMSCFLVATCAMTARATAAPVAYEGTLLFGVPVTGTVGSTGWLDETASEVDFWRVVIPTGGSVIGITGTRLDADLDLVLSFYRGTTAADESAYRSESDWGGLTYLGFADDEIPNAGPGGDPFYSSGFIAAGDYTIAIGGFLSNGEGPYRYSLIVTPSAIPEPAIFMLGAIGLAALARSRKRIAPVSRRISGRTPAA